VRVTVSFIAASLALVMITTPVAAQEKTMIEIPKSIQQEHGAIHNLLVEATKQPGRVGQAAKALAAVLHPHFVREEQIALPPLGLLRELAAGERPVHAAAALAMADSLRNELPRMLEEHKQIHVAVNALRVAAQAERSPRYEQLADQLALHAKTEEEVLYPMAILVGDVIRARGLHQPPR
jgi:iron-sulfur cluster repair protein YtfE (RIC family)